MSKNPLLQTLITMSGQENVITIHRPMVKFLGSLEAALFLEQMLYWTPRSKMGGWVAKSDKEWQGEIFLTRYGVRSAAKVLGERKLIDVQLKRFNNSPTNHYKVNLEELETQWTAWLEALSENEQTGGDCMDSDTPLSENEQTLTETTPEITLSIKGGKPELDLFVGYLGKFLSEKEISRWRILYEAVGKDRSEELLSWAFKKEIHLTNRAGLLDSLETAAKNWREKQIRANSTRVAEPKSFEGIRQFLAEQGVQNG